MSSESEGCEDCEWKDLQIEQLRQKLEHALQMNKLLVNECKRLKREIEETKWKSGCKCVLQAVDQLNVIKFLYLFADTRYCNLFLTKSGTQYSV